MSSEVWAARLIKEHCEQAKNAGYDYDVRVTLEEAGFLSMQVRDLDSGQIDSFVLRIQHAGSSGGTTE